MQEPKGLGEGIDGVDRITPSLKTTALWGGTGMRLHGCMVSLGDEMAEVMVELGVSSGSASEWLRSYVKVLDDCETSDISFPDGGALILNHFSAARDLCAAARLMHHGN